MAKKVKAKNKENGNNGNQDKVPSTNKRVYYAHYMGIFNTEQEAYDIEVLKFLGLEVVNPNNPALQDAFDKMHEAGATNEEAFTTVFLSEVEKCSIFAFKALIDGRIPNDVGLELAYAIENKKVIIELPNGMTGRFINKRGKSPKRG